MTRKPRRWGTAVVACLLMTRIALAQPQESKAALQKADLVELVKLDSTLRLDIRYATANNFLRRKMYTEARAFLQRPAAEALVRAHHALRKKGYGILIFDGYRPWLVSKAFWDETPPEKRKFVANPNKGSKHNRGCAVDCSLYELKTGREVQMPSPYDDFTEKAAANYAGGTEQHRMMRDLLRSAMKVEGFTVNPDEWWHFDYKDWKKYRVMNVPFKKLK